METLIQDKMRDLFVVWFW